MRWRPVARPCLSSLPCHGLDTGIEAGAMTVPLFSLRETPWRSHARRAARCRVACRRRGGGPGVRGRRSARWRAGRNPLRQHRPARRQARRHRPGCGQERGAQRGQPGGAADPARCARFVHGRAALGRPACDPHGMALCDNAMPAAIIHALLDDGTAKIAYPCGFRPCSLPSPSPSRGKAWMGG